MMKTFIEVYFPNIIQSGIKLLVGLVIIIVGFYITKKIVVHMRRNERLNKTNPTLHTFAISTINIVLRALVLVVSASYMGIPMTSVITVLGSAGLALGLALQGGLSNIASSFMIMLFKPFEVGDYINRGDITGTVTYIGLFYSMIKTDSNHRVIYPNSMLTGKELINYSAEKLRRGEYCFFVAYGSDVSKVKQVILDSANANKYIKHDPEPFVYVKQMGSDGIEFKLHAWVDVTEYWSLTFQITEEILRAFDLNGIQVPFPQLDVHMK